MKKLLILLSISLTILLANPLPNIENKFSKLEKTQLLKEFSNSTKLYNSKYYSLKKGWNKVNTPKDGVDLKKTFKDIAKVKFVTTYEPIGKYWAIYSPKAKYPESKNLFLKYIEPNVTFFVLANKDMKIEIKSKSINEACQKLMKDPKFDFIIDNGINKAATMSKDNSLSIASRYYSHNEKGLYDDTRVLVIYPKISTKTKATYKYGPASPKILLKFAKEYENQKFYTYDFKTQKCQRGIFPSPRIPPFPILEVLE